MTENDQSARALGTAGRRQVLANLMLQRSLAGLGFDPGRTALAEALLTPFLGSGLAETLDRRAMERDAAARRLERRAAGLDPWPPPIRRPGR